MRKHRRMSYRRVQPCDMLQSGAHHNCCTRELRSGSSNQSQEAVFCTLFAVNGRVVGTRITAAAARSLFLFVFSFSFVCFY